MHGGASPGAPRGARNGAYKHGLFTHEAIAQRQAFRALMKAARAALEMAEGQ